MMSVHSYDVSRVALRQGSRSASPLSHAESPGAFARLALALYSSRSERVTRTFIRTLAGSLRGGLPLGLLGSDMGILWTHK